MVYSVLADVVVVIHVLFVCFVVLGGALVWRWPGFIWIHLPAVVWGVGIEWAGAVCPLTPLENWLRGQAGGAVYEADFVAEYLLPLLYPAGLTRTAQIVLGVVALSINVAVYGFLWRRHRRRRL